MKSDDLRHGQCAFQIPNTMKEKEEVDMGIMDTLCFEAARNGSSIFEGMCKAEGRHTGGSMCIPNRRSPQYVWKRRRASKHRVEASSCDLCQNGYGCCLSLRFKFVVCSLLFKFVLQVCSLYFAP